MPCDSQRLPEQTLTQRKDEVRKSVSNLSDLLARGKVKIKVGPQGAVVFDGWKGDERGRVTDACAYRRILATGGASVMAKIREAERVAGRQVNQQVVGQGTHSHDGGLTFHDHKG